MSVLLFVIILISSLLRGVFFNITPPELFGDEVDVGYQAYSLLKTGADINGQPFPTYIHSLSEWRAPILIYATVPSIAIFKNTILGVRFPEMVFGSIAPLLVVVLSFLITRSKKISILSGFVLALLPWHIHYSRASFEVVIMLDLLMAGTALLLKKRVVLGCVLMVLAMYTYSTAVLFVPLFLLIIWITNKPLRTVKIPLISAVLCIPLLLNIFTGSAANRFGLVNIWNDTDQVKTINEIRQIDKSGGAQLWHNKVQSISFRFVTNYLQAFSSEFLFIRGDSTQRHGIGQMGVILPFTSPLLLIGIYWLARRKKYVWLTWMLLAPIPAALTTDGGYHATRLFLMVPPIAVAIGAGAFELFRLKRFKIIGSLVIGIYLLAIGYQFNWYWHYYTTHYPVVTWRWWQVGYQEAFKKISTYESQYSRIFINNSYEPALIRYLFYTNYNPRKLQGQAIVDVAQKNITPGYDGFTLDNKFFFGNFNDTKTGIGKRLLPGSLYLLSQRDDVGGDWDWRKSAPSDIKVLETFTNGYDQPVFYLVTKQVSQ